jgi:hypothetical protein
MNKNIEYQRPTVVVVSFNRQLKRIAKLFCFLIPLFSINSCKKLIEVNPPIQSVTASDVYKVDATAAAVITGMYINMAMPGIFTGRSSIAAATGLSADELATVTPEADILTLLYRNNLTLGDNGAWGSLYTYIFKVNAAIEGLTKSTTLTASVKSQLLGEAKFLRAFYYFHLVNLYGDVPLLTSTDIIANSSPRRTEKATVYAQIIQDLKEAEAGLAENYVTSDVSTPTTERTRPNRYAAIALLARVYLYTSRWSEAEAAATTVISQAGMYSLEELDKVFLRNSNEAIWQLQPVALDISNTYEGALYVLSTNNAVTGPDPYIRPFYLNSDLVNSFEIGDKRKEKWIDSVSVNGITYPYANKYKEFLPDAPKSEYLMVLRLSEQYVIRAEARLRQGKLAGVGSASQDLNSIRQRAGLADLTTSNEQELFDAIIKERRAEFFTEWGNRWYDLKRSGKIDEVMLKVAPKKGGIWLPYKALYPIPVYDIQHNPNLKGHQNPGYPEQ